MDLVLVPSVMCKHCSSPPTPILLPYPNPPEKSEGQPAWPAGSWRAYVACHECGHVFEFSARDVSWKPASKRAHLQRQSGQMFWQLEFVCTGMNCSFPIAVFAWAGSAGTIEKVIENMVSTDLQLTTRCLAGHPPKCRNNPSRYVTSGPIQSL